VSQEQKDRVEQTVAAQEESDQEMVTPPGTPSPDSTSSDKDETQQTEGTAGAQQAASQNGKKRVRRRTRLVNVADISPRPSFYPLALALSIAFVLFGVLVSPIMIGIGALLIVISIVGWILENR
jgi:hypothetical protein